ncbi:MAG: DEAD/DEAH box helicase family protein, partial [Syntrophomonadaceae bacterium]|nr:DEAD/DEAH box helicase family protein [Syntrophomonadaceae bacterium]
MDVPFFDHPVLNSPYEYPKRHWELDKDGQPTQRIIENRRRAEFITPIPKARKQRKQQAELVLGTAEDISTDTQQYDIQAVINEVRRHVDEWRLLPNQSDWKVTPETARLLVHWRHHQFSGMRPFFCQVEAVETLIWLTEAAPNTTKGRQFLDHLERARIDANPELLRIALKLATGAGKTTVMAMIIAWQTINAVRYKSSKRFSRAFLVVAPGITIKDRLRVLQPGDPDSYYAKRELVPADLLPEVHKAKIVITNYHAFKLRETLPLAKGTRSLLTGRGEKLLTTETEGQMIQRVMGSLMGIKNVMVINDEAHHCYR